MRQIFLVLSVFLIPAVGQAQILERDQGSALIVGNAEYGTLEDVSNAASLPDYADALGTAGFALFGGRNLANDTLLDQAEAFTADLPDADRSLVVLGGQFLTDGRNSWFVSTDAERPSLLNAGRSGLQIESLLAALSSAEGQSTVVLGVFPKDVDYAPGLRAGLGDLDVPEGVTLISGQVWAVERLLRRLTNATDFDPVGEAGEIDRLSIRRAGDPPPAAPAPPEVAPSSAPVELPDNFASLDEQSSWTVASAVDTEAAYGRYLDRFPGGANVSRAVARLAELRRAPVSPEAATEDALNLTLQARQAIQRDLTVLGFDTRGIDGIFGARTRSAISDWQGQSGDRATGYLTAAQVPALRDAARARGSELDAQASRRRAAQDRLDAELWQATVRDNSEAAYRDYLERFPDGLKADAARQAIETLRAERQDRATAQDRAAWDAARQDDTVAAYRRYLDRDGEGLFDDDATTRIAALRARDRPDPAAEIEAQLGMDPITMQLVESRLRDEGLDPGEVDGQFDDDSRRAIRRYQRDRGLTVTGFLDQATVSRMLVDAIR